MLGPPAKRVAGNTVQFDSDFLRVNTDMISKAGFGMKYRAADCDGCKRTLVQRDWRKLKPMHTLCAFCYHPVYYVIIHWTGYIKRMEDGASIVSL